MIKGCQRKTYHVKNISSKFFDEAYFILKGDVQTPQNTVHAATLAEEADRIIRETTATFSQSRKKSRQGISRALSFAMGVFTSSAIIGIVSLLISLG